MLLPETPTLHRAFVLLLASPEYNVWDLFNLLPAWLLDLSAAYFPCPSFLPLHTTLVTSCLPQKSNISISLYFGISTAFW